MATEAQIKANVKYNKSRDNIMLRPSKEEGRDIRQAAADAGESLQGYILEAVRQRMAAEDLAGSQEPAQPTPEGTEAE